MDAGALSSDPAAQAVGLAARLFLDQRGEAVAVARRVLGDQPLAEDAVQLAFVRLLVHMQADGTAVVEANARGSVRRAARWAALELLQRDRMRHAYRAAPDDPEGVAASDDSGHWHRVETRLLCEQILGALPPRYRDVLTLRFLEDQADTVAAARLHLGTKAYRRRMDRALLAARQLARALGIGASLFEVGEWLRRCIWGRASSTLVRIDSRLRVARSGGNAEVALDNLTHLAVGVAVVAMIAGQSGNAPSWGRPPGATIEALGVGAPLIGGAASRTASGGVNGGMPIPRAGDPAPPPFAPVALIPTSPDQETPGRTLLETVSPAPDYESSHVIMAQGVGADCRCQVLLRSADGGATWASALSPMASTSAVVLPPRYPSDPRFILTQAGLPSTSCLMPAFGSAACVPLPVDGQASFDAEFDSGFPVIYGSEQGVGVVAYNLVTQRTRVILASADADVMLAAPAGAAATSLYVVATSSFQPVAGPGQPMRRGSVLYACRRDFSCTPVSTNTAFPNGLALDRNDAQGRLIGSMPDSPSGWRVLSTDGGSTFSAVAPPQAYGADALQIAGPAPAPTLWASMSPPGAVATLWRRSLIDATWHQVRLPRLNDPYWAVFSAVDADTIIVLDAPGFWCSTDDGATWAPSRCRR